MSRPNAKRVALEPSLAELAAEQVLVAHHHVASNVLDALWKDPDTLKELTKRVLGQKRDTQLRKESFVAIVGVVATFSEGLETAMGMPLMVPADKLPEWLFILLQAWADHKLLLERPWYSPGGQNPKSEPWPRCGMGGLQLGVGASPLHCGLEKAWDHLLGHYGAETICRGEMVKGLGPNLWAAFGLDADEQFEDEKAELLSSSQESDQDPLVLFADRACDILRDEIFNEANAFFEDDTLLELARKMGAINTQRAFLPAPFVTIVLEV